MVITVGSRVEVVIRKVLPAENFGIATGPIGILKLK